MVRWCVLALLVGCEARTEISAPAHDHASAVPTSWPLGRVVGQIGRDVAPQFVVPLGLDGEVPAGATPWQVPGDGPARAVLGARDAAMLVEIDRRHVAWRGRCRGGVVGVTATTIVCATQALALDGRAAWQLDAPVVAMTGDRIVTDAGDGKVTVRDARTGGELATVAMPAGATAIAACDRDVYAAMPDGKLARIAGKLLWAVPPIPPPPKAPLDAPVAMPILPGGIDPCEGATLLAVVAATSGPTLVALARDTGKLVGRIDGVRGLWPARTRADQLEVATAHGVERVPRELAPGDVLPLPALGALLAVRGESRLVRATPSTAVVLDARGIRAFVPLAAAAAALGDDAMLAGAQLVALPRAWRRPLRLPPDPIGLALPAELRDLPAPVRLDPAAGVALRDVTQPFAARALDPLEPALYVAAGETVARFDLAARAWTWQRGGACPPGERVSLAASRSIVACATTNGILATTRDGTAAWRSSIGAGALEAAADVVVAHGIDRVHVLAAEDGRVLGTLATAHAAAIDIAGMALVIAAEGDRVVARLPRAYMLPAWSIRVHGVVASIAASGDGVLVALEDGDAYRIDARTARSVALPGIGLAWRAPGDLVTGDTAGGPVPPHPLPIPPRPLVPEKYKPVDLEAAPAIATPWPPPPPMAASWQLVLFELAGGLRVRDDYALVPPIAFAVRRGAGPLVVIDRAHHALVIEPVRGDVLRHIELPRDASDDAAFSTIVDGVPVTGTILAAPLRVVVF